MRKYRVIVFSLIVLFLFNGCSALKYGREYVFMELPVSSWDPGMFRSIKSTSSYYVDPFLELLISAIAQKDTDSLKNLFAPNVLLDETTDEQIESLFRFFEGEVTSIHRPAAYSHKSKDGSLQYEEICITCDIGTTSGDYRMAVKVCIVDTEDENNVGVCSLYIIDAANTDMQFAYWGNHEWLRGIVIETGDIPLP